VRPHGENIEYDKLRDRYDALAAELAEHLAEHTVSDNANDLLHDRIRALEARDREIREARLVWAMTCDCRCPGCQGFDEVVNGTSQETGAKPPQPQFGITEPESTLCIHCGKSVGYHYQTAIGQLFCEPPSASKIGDVK